MLRLAVLLFLIQEYNCYLVLHPNVTHEESPPFEPINSGAIPTYFDWRDHQAVSPVKNQFTCKAGWAFSIVAAMESHLKIYKNVEKTLSEQFLIDCLTYSNKAGTKQIGCRSWYLVEVLSDVVGHFGGVLEDRFYFPYSNQVEDCRWIRIFFDTTTSPHDGQLQNPKPKPVSYRTVPATGFHKVPRDEHAMAEYLYRYGPLMAMINMDSMVNYKGGIDEPTVEQCKPKGLNHAVLIVGYNEYISDAGEHTPYWIIKNSWGDSWGDQGFYYLVRGKNACGISFDVSFPYVN